MAQCPLIFIRFVSGLFKNELGIRMNLLLIRLQL
jgi:hypothetical protein